jgi:histidyl-tRNA synthetase
MDKISRIKGFVDLLPPESDAFTHMEQIAREVFSRYGFGEIRVPVVEFTELFARSIGEETDVVQKEMYTFPDRKGRSLTLRPEATAGVARAYLDNNLHAQDRVARLYTFGPMFRYERPQKGRQRQFHQVDAEDMGSGSPLVDAEVILMLWTFLTALGLKDLALELNSLGCPECRPRFKQALADFFASLDKDRLCADCLRRSDTNPLRVLDCKVPECKSATANAPVITEHLCDGCRSHDAAVREVLDRANLVYTLNPRLVRGLDYYQRTAFEVTSGKIGAQAAVAGGGRYDGLVKELGGPNVPCIGFACGMERLAMLMARPEPARLDFYLACTTPADPAGLAGIALLAQRLRDRGHTGEASYEPRSAKSHLRAANRSGARFCLLVGPEELAQGSVWFKDMTTGEQTTVQTDSLLGGDLLGRTSTGQDNPMDDPLGGDDLM